MTPIDIDCLPLEIKAGQMVMAGFSGADPPRHILASIKEGRLGGIILFGDSSASPRKLRDMTTRLQEAAMEGAAGLPLLIATDQEGGRVNRLSPPMTEYPSARALGAAGSPELAAEMGGALARELLALGVNVNLAPVLDVDSNPLNPVIGDRSLSGDAGLTSELGVALIKGLQDEGVMAVAKHFPGHGDTSFDSHDMLGSVGRSSESLWETEIRPFRAAVDAGVGAVMTAHVIYTGIDPLLPATLSDKIVGGLLRDRLGHGGLVITDDMEMKAMADSYSMEIAAPAALSAGVDMILVCKDRGEQERAYGSLLEAASRGSVSMERVNRAVKRILQAKERFASADYNIDIEVVNCEEHKGLVRRIEESD